MKRILTAVSVAALFATSPALAQSTTGTQNQPAATQSNETMKKNNAAQARSGEQFTKVESMEGVRVNQLIGASIMNAQNESIGDINDIVLAGGGEVDQVIVGVGGFLGLGERNVALKLRELQMMTNADGDLRLMTQLTQKDLEAVEAYEPKKM
ncbi:MAG: PRC-barrel domain-containing protein [Pseudomonadota bacterium]